MSWRWISITALLGALVLGYGALTGRNSLEITSVDPPRQPGYYLHDAVVTQTRADGNPSLRLISERIEQNRAVDGITLQKVKVNYVTEKQKPWLLTAERGFVPGDSRIVQLTGDVNLRPADETENAYLRTQSLHVDLQRNLAYATQSPADIQLRNNRLTVRRFEADLNTEKIKLESVRGRFKP